MKVIARLVFLVALLLGGIALIFKDDITLFFNVDTCLDRGGRWDYDTGACNYHPEEEVARERNCAARNMIWDDETNLCRWF